MSQPAGRMSPWRTIYMRTAIYDSYVTLNRRTLTRDNAFITRQSVRKGVSSISPPSKVMDHLGEVIRIYKQLKSDIKHLLIS